MANREGQQPLAFHRDRWLGYLLSTDLADRTKAEDAARQLYALARFAAPQHFLWYDSPLASVWAAALLAEPHDTRLQNALESLTRQGRQGDRIAEVRTEIRQRLGVAGWPEALAAVGRRHTMMEYRVQGPFPMPSPRLDSLQAKLVLAWPDGARELLNPNEEISQAVDAVGKLESVYYSRHGEGLLATHAKLNGAGGLASIIAESMYNDFPWALMARYDTSAAITGFSAPSPYSCAAAIAQAAGLWWAFENAVVFTDRPVTLALDGQSRPHNESGAAIRYRDGCEVYAWHGSCVAPDLLLHPESATRSVIQQQPDPTFRKFLMARAGLSRKEAKISKILSVELPAGSDERLRVLRQHTAHLPLFEHYQAGECEPVWAELLSLDARVRTDPYAADALAVAYETMNRVAANVETLIGRLQTLGYRFWTPAAEMDRRSAQIESLLTMPLPKSPPAAGPRPDILQQLFQHTEKARDLLREQAQKLRAAPRDTRIQARTPPGRKAWQSIRKLEKAAGTLPLSLRAFYDVVGSVNLLGVHPRLTPAPEDASSSLCPDPLVVFPVEEALDEIEGDGEEGESNRISIAPDALHKAGTSGGDPYSIEVPNPGADALLLDESHNLPFVAYLRLCFRWGGFPGYEGFEGSIPSEIEFLREGLLSL